MRRTLRHELITTSLRSDGDSLVLQVDGCAESETFEAINAAIANANTTALDTKSKRIVMDVRRLEFATSSCLKAIASWVVELPTPSPYGIVFRATTKHSWQRRSLQAIAACSPDVVTVELEA